MSVIKQEMQSLTAQCNISSTAVQDLDEKKLKTDEIVDIFIERGPFVLPSFTIVQFHVKSEALSRAMKQHKHILRRKIRLAKKKSAAISSAPPVVTIGTYYYY